MTKPVWKNAKTGKYYTLEGEGEGTVFMTVYVDDDVWENAQANVDKSGKIFKILDCTAHQTKNGFDVYRVSRPKKTE